MSTSTTGTGTITLGSALSGYQSFTAAGLTTGAITRYTIQDGVNWEIGLGTYTTSGTTLTRTPSESSSGGSAISLSGNAEVFITAAAEDVSPLYDANFVTQTTSSYNGPSATGTDAIAIGLDALASGTRSVGIGALATGTNVGAIASGNGAVALGGSNASGTEAFSANNSRNDATFGSTGANSVTLGYQSRAQATYSIAIGYAAIAGGQYGIALGFSRANGEQSFSIGQNASTASGENTIVIGKAISSSVDNEIAIGGTGNTIKLFNAYTLPTSDGAAGTALVTNGSGALSFSAVGAALYDANESSPSAQPSATGANAIAIGDRATASGSKAIALGWGQSQGYHSMSGPIGNYLSTYGAIADHSLAIGSEAKASGSYGVALGRSVVASGSQSLSLGYGGTASAINAVAIGDSNTASHANAIVIGDSVQSTTTNEVSIGGTADTVRISESYTLPTSDGSAGTALVTNGSGALSFSSVGADLYAANDVNATAPSATGDNSVAIGPSSEANAADATAFGYRSEAKASKAVAIGEGRAGGTSATSISIGTTSTAYGATGSNSVAIGNQAKATNAHAIAIGRDNISSGSQTSIAIGQSNNVTGMRGVAIGSDNTVSGLIAHAYGAANTVSGQYAVAFNRSNDAASNYSFVSGYYADSHGVKGRLARGTGGLSLNGTKGDAQYGLLVLSKNTTDATQTALSTDTLTAGSDNQLVVQNNGAVAFHGTIVAKQASSSNVAAWEVKGLMHNVTTATLVNSAITVINNAPGWGLAISADTTNDAVQFLVTGAAVNISWVATIHSSEVIRS